MHNPNKEIDQGFENHVEKNLSSAITFIPIMVKVLRDRLSATCFLFCRLHQLPKNWSQGKGYVVNLLKTETKALITQLEKGASLTSTFFKLSDC